MKQTSCLNHDGLRPRVLVLECHARASIEIIRSLLRRNVEVVAASDRRVCSGFFTRGLRCREVYPSVDTQPEAFIDWLLDYLTRHPVQMLQPLGDVCVELIARHQQKIREHTLLLMPEYPQFMVAYDKIASNKAAEAAGVPIPRSWYPDETGLDPVRHSAEFPVLVKPSVGVGARGIVKVETPSELDAAWASAQVPGKRAFIQEMIPMTGRQLVLDILIDRNFRRIAAVASEKVRFFPVKGGASTLSRSVHRPELCEKISRMLVSMGYYGIGNIDLMDDPRDGEAKFLEINPRFGEMHAICNWVGIDVPYLLYRLAKGETVEEIRDYPEGKYFRFLPTDLMWFLTSPDRCNADPGFWASFGKNVKHTLFEKKDIGPLVGYVLENLILLANPKGFAHRFVR